jgi:hypothetical protein
MKMQDKGGNAGKELLDDAGIGMKSPDTISELFGEGGIGMKALDRILELLQDAQPHSFDEIKAQIPLPAERLALVLDFLAEFKFIALLDTDARITPLGLSILELPAETPSD